MTFRPAIATAALVLSLCATAGAQFIIDSPKLPGVWNPVVGAGSVYAVERGDRRLQVEIAVVGQEAVGQSKGYWTEMALTFQDSGRSSLIRRLLVPVDGELASKRIIVQPPGAAPMEVPPKTMLGGENTGEPVDIRLDAERLGAEDVTTPAGTFACTRYRLKDGRGEIWLSDKVTPWGLVKMNGPDVSVTLARVISGAASQMTGTPTMVLPTQPASPKQQQQQLQQKPKSGR